MIALELSKGIIKKWFTKQLLLKINFPRYFEIFLFLTWKKNPCCNSFHKTSFLQNVIMDFLKLQLKSIYTWISILLDNINSRSFITLFCRLLSILPALPIQNYPFRFMDSFVLYETYFYQRDFLFLRFCIFNDFYMDLLKDYRINPLISR